MSVGISLVLSIVKEKSRAKLLEIPQELLRTDEERSLYDFVRRHVSRHNKFPGLLTLKKRFSVQGLPKEPTGYYMEEAQRRAFYNLVRDPYARLGEAFQGAQSDIDAMFDIIDELASIRRRFNVANDGVEDSPSLLAQVLQEFEEASLYHGLRGVPSGWDEVDDVTGGYQPADHIVWVGRPGRGKCLAPNTLVIKYDGSLVPVSSLSVGDTVMGPDSMPRTVIRTATGKDRMYRITPKHGGDSFTVTQDHKLVLEFVKNVDTIHRKNTRHTYTVAEYLRLSDRIKRSAKLIRVPLDFQESQAPLPYSAYFVGLWMGDGTRGRAQITTEDLSIVNYLREFAHNHGYSLYQNRKTDNAAATYSFSYQKGYVNHLLDFCRTLTNEREEKYIPHNYLCSDRESRLLLLAGLIDSDGHYDRVNSKYEITLKDGPLVQQLAYLCRGLGFCASINIKKVSDYPDNTYYRICLTGNNLHTIPCKLRRKQARRHDAVMRHSKLLTGFNVDYVGVSDYFGIEVSGDSLYLLGDCTVTHNSWLLLYQCYKAWAAGHKVLYVSNEMEGRASMRRMVGIHSRINPNLIRTGTVSTHSQDLVRRAIAEMNEITPMQMVTANFDRSVPQVESYMDQYEPDVCMIDAGYLLRPQKKRYGSSGRRETISDVAEELKALAADKHRPIVSTMQFNREAEQRRRASMSRQRERGQSGDNRRINPIAHLGVEVIGETDVVGQSASHVFGMDIGPSPFEKSIRVFGLLKGREGEDGSWYCNYPETRTSPIDLSLLPYDDPRIEIMERPQAQSSRNREGAPAPNPDMLNFMR